MQFFFVSTSLTQTSDIINTCVITDLNLGLKVILNFQSSLKLVILTKDSKIIFRNDFLQLAIPASINYE